MRVRALLLAAVVALATVAPARADIVLGWALSTQMGPTDPVNNPITDSDTVAGAPLSAFTMTVGQTAYLQVTITATGSPSGTGTWANSPTAKRLVSYGTSIDTYDSNANPASATIGTAFIQNPFLDPAGPPGAGQGNTGNLNVPQPFGVGHPSTFPPNPPGGPGYNMGRTAFTGTTTASGIGPSNPVSQTFVLATFELNALQATPAGAPAYLDLSRIDPNPNSTLFGLGDGTTLDSIIFAAGHNFRIPVTVLPEPTSMALCGVALVGFGWRKLRRTKKAVAA